MKLICVLHSALLPKLLLHLLIDSIHGRDVATQRRRCMLQGGQTRPLYATFHAPPPLYTWQRSPLTCRQSSSPLCFAATHLL